MDTDRPSERVVSLREISAETVREICALAVGPDQQGLVAPNAVSIAQAYFEPAAWFRAVCAGEIDDGEIVLELPLAAVAPD